MKKEDFKKKTEESEEQFVWRLCFAKDSGVIDMTWDELAETLNAELREDESDYLSSSAYRKKYQYAKKMYDEVFSKMVSNEYADDIAEKHRELERMKIQYRDQRNAWNKQNYADARVEETFDILEEKLSELGKINFENIENYVEVNTDKEMIVCLSDLHIGQNFKSLWGEYNSYIAKKRLGQYLEKIKEVRKKENISKVHLVLLGDEISGKIHKTVQISNKENVNEQIKLATELISSFCYECCKEFNKVLFYNVSGNHTRLDKKEDALKDERLDDIIGWAVNLSLQHLEQFTYLSHRNLDIGIVDMSVCGKTYLGVHGDYDAMSKQGTADLSMMLGFVPYCILRGHCHTPALNEYQGVKVIQSGSLPGCGDDYTIQKRLLGKPSQTMLVCDKRGIEAIYNVELD